MAKARRKKQPNAEGWDPRTDYIPARPVPLHRKTKSVAMDGGPPKGSKRLRASAVRCCPLCKTPLALGHLASCAELFAPPNA